MIATRRTLFGSAASVLAAAPGRAALPAAALLVPGPADGPAARWAARLTAAMGASSGPRGVTGPPRLSPRVLGGPDGVTAANRFATEAGPDGRTLLVLTPGALQAQLVGEQRARFDGAGWLPVCASRGTALVVGRGSLPGAGETLRLGLGPADAAGTAALLALDLMGRRAQPMLGLLPHAAMAALEAGEVDAVVLVGNSAEIAARLEAADARPWFTLTDAREGVDGLCSAFELITGAPPPLLAALRVAAANAVLDAALVLPGLTPADVVAQWRSAAVRWADAEARTRQAASGPLLAGHAATPLLAGLAAPPEATLAYREWLLRRLNWRVS